MALEEHDLEFVEQPCGTLEELAEVRERVSTPIAADESVTTIEQVRRAIELGACDVVNLKLAGCGGFGPAREALREARENGLEVFLSSTLDGPWGIAAALQLAAAEDVTLACGLATLDLFDARIAGVLPKPRGGLQLVPQGPGLGVPEDLEALDEVLVGLARGSGASAAPRRARSAGSSSWNEAAAARPRCSGGRPSPVG